MGLLTNNGLSVSSGGGKVTLAGAETLSNKTLAGYTLTAPVVTAETVVSGTEVDVTKPISSKAISDSTVTLTFSATPSTGTSFMLIVRNTDTSDHTITLPSVFSEAQGASVTAFSVGAESALTLAIRREASRYVVYGDAPTATPAASQSEMETGTETAIREMSPLRVAQSHAAKAPLNSPALTGTPTAPTPTTATNTTQIATTAFVHAVAATVEAGVATGDVKFVPDAYPIPAGWSLTGVNGIPAFTTPDADYKPLVKVGGTVANVTFTPVAGEVAVDSTVALATATPGASIRYTTNGDTPTRSSGTVYSGPVTIGAALTIKAIAYLDYWIDSAVTEAAYTVPASVSPSYVAEVATRLSNTSSASTSVLTFNATVPVGRRVVVMIRTESSTQTVTSLVDSKGNSWTRNVDELFTDSAAQRMVIFSSVLTTELVSGDTATVTWDNPHFSYRGMAAFALANAGNNTPDVTSSTHQTSTTAPSSPATTTAAATVAIGMLRTSTSFTYTSAWQIIGGPHDFGGTNRQYYFYEEFASAGSKNPAGTISPSAAMASISWVAYSA